VLTAELLRYDGDTLALRRAFAQYPSGVVALIAEVDGAPTPLVASSFTVGVSANPPLVSVAIQHSSTSWPAIRGADRIGVSVFAHDQAGLARQLSVPDRERRLQGVDLQGSGSSARYLDGAAMWFETSLHDEVRAGDHTIALLEVRALREFEARLPLIFHNSTFTTLRD